MNISYDLIFLSSIRSILRFMLNQAIVRSIFQRFVQLILFGSYSRGNARPWSDIDVAVVGKRFGKNPIKEGVLLDEVADQVSLALEPHPINLKDFQEGSDPFILQVKKYGINFT